MSRNNTKCHFELAVIQITVNSIRFTMYCEINGSDAIFLSKTFILSCKMAKKKEISIEKRAQVIILKKAGKTQREIAALVGISQKGVFSTLKRYTETGSNVDKNRSGRPRKTNKHDDRRIGAISENDRFKTAPDITAEINRTLPNPISVTTVKDRLKNKGLVGRVAAKKPLLRAVNKQKRLKFAKEHENWTMEQWKSVLWTDESKFEIFGSKRRQFVRRKPGERFKSKCIAPTVKHGGGSVMVWGCFSFEGVGELFKINGIMKKEQYRQILQRIAIPSGVGLIGYGFVFQQDNDPKHTSNYCQNYLKSKEEEGVLELMEWPPQSPDSNPIELLWDELDRKVRSMRPTSESHLWECLQRAWNNIELETLQKLVERMPRVCKAIIKARGDHIDEKQLK